MRVDRSRTESDAYRETNAAEHCSNDHEILDTDIANEVETSVEAQGNNYSRNDSERRGNIDGLLAARIVRVMQSVHSHG